LAAGGDPLDRAAELLEYGRLDEARNLLLELVAQRQPGQATACALLGRAYANLGQWSEAERWCRESVRLDRLMLEAYYTLALVLQHQGQLDEAIDAMKKVVYIDRNHVLGHYGLASLYHGRGDLARALRSLDNARRLLDAGPAGAGGRGAPTSTVGVIPGSGGITADRLREAILRQQQRWGAGAHGT
jgi:chemotaxis protein methyltransferase CheR